MKRREFISLLGGAAVASPRAARTQQPERMRRIGVLLPASPDDAVFQARVETFVQELARLGWTIERNIQIDIRWASTNANEIRRHAAELAALSPDVILATGDSTMPPLLQATRTILIVFPVGMDPVANGYIDSLARPGGNATGFMDFEYRVSGKWLELLKEAATQVERVGLMVYPETPVLTSSKLLKPWPLRSRSSQSRSVCISSMACWQWTNRCRSRATKGQRRATARPLIETEEERARCLNPDRYNAEHHGDWNLRRCASMDSHRRHHGGVFLVRCVSRRSTAPADRRRLVPHKRAAWKDVCLSALQKRELRHHRALGRLRRAGDQLRTQYDQASRRGLATELWLLGCWAIMAGG